MTQPCPRVSSGLGLGPVQFASAVVQFCLAALAIGVDQRASPRHETSHSDRARGAISTRLEYAVKWFMGLWGPTRPRGRHPMSPNWAVTLLPPILPGIVA